MRILLVTHYYAEHRGGVEIVALELAKRLANRGIDLVWAASGPFVGTPHQRITPQPMQTCNAAERWFGFPYPLWGPNSVRRLWQEVRRADLVHVHDALYCGSLLAFLGARRFGKPLVVTQHIGMVPYKSAVLRRVLEFANHTLARTILRGCDQAIFISDRVRQYFAEFVAFRNEAMLVHNGVDAELFRPLSPSERLTARHALGWADDKLRILFVGRFVEKKGLPLVQHLATTFPELQWVFAGWGADDPAEWHLPNVACLGALDHDQLVTYYQAADLLVLPSVGEGFPLVVQEAMACGTPALISEETASGVPGVERVSLVCRPEAQSLAQMIRGLLANPDELSMRRGAAVEFARANWNWKDCADRYQEVFARLLGTKNETAVEEQRTIGREGGGRDSIQD